MWGSEKRKPLPIAAATFPETGEPMSKSMMSLLLPICFGLGACESETLSSQRSFKTR
jgi:hypothetical protein